MGAFFRAEFGHRNKFWSNRDDINKSSILTLKWYPCILDLIGTCMMVSLIFCLIFFHLFVWTCCFVYFSRIPFGGWCFVYLMVLYHKLLFPRIFFPNGALRSGTLARGLLFLVTECVHSTTKEFYLRNTKQYSCCFDNYCVFVYIVSCESLHIVCL